MEKLIKKIYYLFNETVETASKDERNLEIATALIDEKIRLNIFKEAYYNNEETKNILEQVNKKIDEIELKIIEEQQIFNDTPLSEGNINIDILNEILDELLKLKNDILTGNNDFTKENLINITDYKEFRELTNICVETLMTKNNQILTFFGEPIAWYNSDNLENKYILNEEVINRIYKILNSRRLHEGLKQNIPIKERKINLQSKIIYYRIILKHKERIKKYFELSKIISTINNEINALNVELNKINGILCYNTILENSTNLFDKLFKRKKLKELPTKVHIINTVIESSNITELLSKIEQKISEKQNTLKELEISRDNILIEAHSSKLKNIMETCNCSFREREKVRTLINTNDEEIENNIKKLREQLNNLPSYTGKKDVINLIVSDYETCKNILDLEKTKENQECSPIICFYILKTLIELKSTNITDYEDNYNNVNVIKSAYEELIHQSNLIYQKRLDNFANIDKILEERNLTYQVYQKYIDFLKNNQNNRSTYSRKRKYN